MTALLKALIAFLLPYLADIAARLLAIQVGLKEAATETQPYRIQNDAEASRLALIDAYSGNFAIRQAIDAIAPPSGPTIQDVLNAIAALPAGSSIVIPADTDNASAVWSHVMNALAWKYPNKQADTMVSNAFDILNNLVETIQTPAQGPPGFALDWDKNLGTADFGTFVWPKPDYTLMGSYANAVDWLNATDASGRTWTLDADTGWPVSYDHLYDTLAYAAIRWVGEFVAQPVQVGAPIWPGIDLVTLGSTVPAVVSTVLELPMDGIIWLTTSYPPARARWGAAPYYSVYHTGRLAFITDNGDLEPFQYMGWQNAVYVPQTMGRAAGVVVFLEANIEGAITPWDISV